MKKKHVKHTNSYLIADMQRDVETVEKLLRKLGIPITYPDLSHELTPMIGHTKGNTSNNRKKIKRHHGKELAKVWSHLHSLLPEDVRDRGEMFLARSNRHATQHMSLSRSDTEDEDDGFSIHDFT